MHFFDLIGDCEQYFWTLDCVGAREEVGRFDFGELFIMAIVFGGESVLPVFEEKILYFGSVLVSQSFLFGVVESGQSVCLGGHRIIFFP